MGTLEVTPWRQRGTAGKPVTTASRTRGRVGRPCRSRYWEGRQGEAVPKRARVGARADGGGAKNVQAGATRKAPALCGGHNPTTDALGSCATSHAVVRAAPATNRESTNRRYAASPTRPSGRTPPPRGPADSHVSQAKGGYDADDPVADHHRPTDLPLRSSRNVDGATSSSGG